MPIDFLIDAITCAPGLKSSVSQTMRVRDGSESNT